MIITLEKDTPQNIIDEMIFGFEQQGLKVSFIQGVNYNVFGLVGDTTRLDERIIQANEWVSNVQRVQAPYKLANKKHIHLFSLLLSPCLHCSFCKSNK